MAPYQLDDLSDRLDLTLPANDAPVFENYETTPLSKVSDGYAVENFRGLDIAVLAYPKEIDVQAGGPTPTYYAQFEDELYQAEVAIAPKAMDWEDVFETDADLEIGLDRRTFSPEPYVGLEGRTEPAEPVTEMIERRGDIEEGAKTVIGDYVQYDVDASADSSGLLAAVQASLTEEDDPVTVAHDRADALAYHFL